MSGYIVNFNGILLHCTQDVYRIFPKDYTYETFPDNFCGAGDGLGEKLVPDYIFGITRGLGWLGLDVSIKISMACYIHDKDWQFSAPTFKAFDSSNDRFHKNIEAIIHAKAINEWVKARAMYRPVTYMNAVSLAGRFVFWSLKKAQGYTIPSDAIEFVNHEYVDKIKVKVKSGEVMRADQ